MNNIFILLAMLLGLLISNAQDFKTTQKYTLMNERVIDQEEERGNGLIDLVTIDDTSRTMATLPISEIELLEEVHISVLTSPGLEDISEIIKVELAYSACCTSTETYYFLVADDDNLLKLPSIGNLYCGEEVADMHYVFPSQGHGVEGTILRAKRYYSTSYTVNKIEVVQSYVWKDDDFEMEEALSAIIN